jgi:hypothetical protein
VSVDEIEKNEFNSNIPRYIDSQEGGENHLRGGIPTPDIDALEPYWTVCASRVFLHGLARRLLTARSGHLDRLGPRDPQKELPCWRHRAVSVPVRGIGEEGGTRPS